MSTATKKINETAEALRECLISPNVLDSNLECANMVDVIHQFDRSGFAIAKAIDALAEAIRAAQPVSEGTNTG